MKIRREEKKKLRRCPTDIDTERLWAYLIVTLVVLSESNCRLAKTGLMERGVLDKLFFRKGNQEVSHEQERETKEEHYYPSVNNMAKQSVQPSDVAGLSPEYAELAINAERLMSTLEESCTWGK